MAIGRTLSVGIDLGTNQVKVVVVELSSRDSAKESRGENRGESRSEKSHASSRFDASPRVLGAGIADTRGMRHGYITSITEVAKSIRAAVDQAQKNAGVPIKKAFVSVGGIGLGAIISTGMVNTTKADAEITDLDVRRAIEESEKELPSSYIQNRKIIHTIPLEYRIDSKRVLGKPQGLKGIRLEARVLYMTCLSHHLSDLLLAFEEANIEVMDVVASPMAASIVTLNKTQKIAGCILANIGSQTSSIIVFENNIPISMEVFPFGSNDVTNDIALGLKVSLEEAEQIKLGIDNGLSYSRRKLDEIVIARLSDVFDLIDDHLKRIDRNGLLPAGIILTGGGAGLSNVEELAKIALHLPSKQSYTAMQGNLKNISKEFQWSVAYGLAILGLGNDEGIPGQHATIGSGLFSKVLRWIKQFLP